MLEQSVLSNALNIVTNRLPNRDSIGLAIWVRVGGRHERKGLSGISHFVEHMLFKGTKTRSTKRIKEEVEGVGGTMNAFTGEESTCYFVKIPKQHLAAAFDVLQDMVNHSILKSEEVAKERTVILEEIKMYLDQPSHHVHEIMGELLWPNHALGRPIAGTIETVSEIRRHDLARHIRSYYHPGNLLVTACGDISHEQVHSLTEGFFKERRREPPSTFKPVHIEGTSKESRIRFLEKKTEQTHFVLGFHGLSRSDPARYQLAVLHIILGGNMSSRLFEEVREQRGLAYEIRSSTSFFEDAGAVLVSAGVEPKKAPFAIRVIMRELNRLKHKPVSEEELKRAKDYFLGQLLLGLEDTLDNILWYGERVLYGDPLPSVEEIKRGVDEVTARDLQELAKRIFQDQHIHLSLIGPLDGKYERKIRAETML